jgi:hypothetical protein
VAHMVADAERGVRAAVMGDGGWMAVGGDEYEPVAPPRLPR